MCPVLLGLSREDTGDRASLRGQTVQEMGQAIPRLRTRRHGQLPHHRRQPMIGQPPDCDVTTRTTNKRRLKLKLLSDGQIQQPNTNDVDHVYNCSFCSLYERTVGLFSKLFVQF